MSTGLTWDTSPAASALHAARLVVSGRLLANTLLSDTVCLPAERLRREITALELPSDVVWSQLICHAREGVEPRQRSEAALCAAGLSAKQVDQASGRLTERVAELESTHAAAYPDLSRELQLRCGPLRQLWEGRGPGLLRKVGAITGIATLSGNATLAEDSGAARPATVLVVQPALGGGGQAFPLEDAVLIEAVLANPLSALPEVARLGWLLAQLHAKTRQAPLAADNCQETRLWQWALLPAVLDAAQFVELARFDVDTLAQALATWLLVPPTAANPNDLAERLLAWWNSFRETRPTWDVAFARLRNLIQDGSTGP